MMWRKEFGVNHVKNTDYILTAILIFSVIGIIFQYTIAFVIVSIFLTYFMINKFYDKMIGRQLTLKNPTFSGRFFPGEETILKFELTNHSFYPIINGRFKFQTGPAIQTLHGTKESTSRERNVDVPLSIMGKRKATVELPIVTKQRGATRMTNITYQFPHLFNFDRVSLNYLPFYQTEFIVFPKLLPVQGLESIYQMVPGDERMNFSLFEDIQSPVGTRDYNSSDSFHRVNWKATAKTGKLQTNVYDHVVDMSYIFIVNIGLDETLKMSEFNQNLEKILSYTAYLCQETTQREFNYEVFINMRGTGRIPYLHIREGGGKAHYVNTLESLARIHQQALVFPFRQMVYQVGQQFYKRKTVVILGEISPEVSELINIWHRQQQVIYHVNTSNMSDAAYIKRWKREVTRSAKQTS